MADSIDRELDSFYYKGVTEADEALAQQFINVATGEAPLEEKIARVQEMHLASKFGAWKVVLRRYEEVANFMAEVRDFYLYQVDPVRHGAKNG